MHVLQDEPEEPAQLVERQLADVDAVDGDAAAVDVVEPQQQVDDRRLAGAGRPDDADALSGFDRERHVAQHVVLVVVREPDVVEGDVGVGWVRRVRRVRPGAVGAWVHLTRPAHSTAPVHPRTCAPAPPSPAHLIAWSVSSSWKIRSDDAIAPCRMLNFSDRS